MNPCVDDGIILFAKKKLSKVPAMEITLEEPDMQDEHIKKLTEGRNDLAGKIRRLKKFMKSDKFDTFSGYDQYLLSIQKSQMKALLKTLDARIKTLTEMLIRKGC